MTHREGQVLRVLVGDDTGARVELEVPYKREYRDIRVRDTAHLVVVSDTANMDRFRALREVYLPETRCVFKFSPLQEELSS